MAVCLTLIENGEVWAPEPRGRCPILLGGDKILKIGETDARAGSSLLGLDLDVIDASGCVVTPGFIDPHSHLTGGSGGARTSVSIRWKRTPASGSAARGAGGGEDRRAGEGRGWGAGSRPSPPPQVARRRPRLKPGATHGCA